MKKMMIGLITLLMSLSAQAANCDLVIRQLDTFGSEVPRLVMVPAGCAGQSGVLIYDAVSTQPQILAGTNAQYLRGDATLATFPVPFQSLASRSLDSPFQISTTRNALVSYSVQITVTASITGGQNGDVILEIASDVGFTANVQTLAIVGLGQTYTLALALQGVQPLTGVVSGFVPSGYYTRLRTVNNTGTPGFAYRAGQEVLL